MRPTFPGAPVVAETRTLPSDVLGNGRPLKAVEAGGRIGASVAPCECIPCQQHDARAVGFCRHKLRPPAAAGAAIWSSMPAANARPHEVTAGRRGHKTE